MDPDGARTDGRARLPLADVPAWRRALRYRATRAFVGIVARIFFRFEVEGAENIAASPALYCFNHMSWVDPFALMAVLPDRPKVYFFGPKEEDMSVGARNRLMVWSGVAVPFRPEKDDLLETARRVRAVFESGAVMAIAGEGRIHVHEGDLLPLQEGAAYFALRSGVPIVPVGINGTSWLWWRCRIQIRFGSPIPASGRATHGSIRAYTARTWLAIHDLVADSPPRPRPTGRVGLWLSDLFNDWGPGGRDAAASVRGPDRADVAAVVEMPERGGGERTPAVAG
jgi:1-acyl-sn-glycerol-3-phosphate acyltransferase